MTIFYGSFWRRIWVRTTKIHQLPNPGYFSTISITDSYSHQRQVNIFSNFSCMFLYPKSNCSNLSYLRNLQEQVKKAFCYQKLFWPFTVRRNCSSDLKMFANSRPSASNFKIFSRPLERFFLTVGQNNFGNKIPKLFYQKIALFMILLKFRTILLPKGFMLLWREHM